MLLRLFIFCVCDHRANKCVCIPEKQPLLPEMALKCQMKRFPGKVIKMYDPFKAMVSCSLHRSCKSTTSITDVKVIFHLVSLPGIAGCGDEV